MVPSMRAAQPVLLLVLLFTAAACSDPATPFQADAQFNKGKNPPKSGDPTVSSVDPPFAYQGDVIDGVRIYGSNYTEGAQASWERNGIADPRVLVRSTRFISATEIEADITVQGDAEIAYYDVAVTLPGGKRGVGIESFQISSRETNTTPTFFFPNSGTDVTGDAIITAGDQSVYANKVCNVQTEVFRNGTGDAVLSMPSKLTGNNKGCPGLRRLRFTWQDGYQESLVTRVNVGAVGSGTGTGGIYAVQVGRSRSMPMNIPIPDSKRCTFLKFRWYLVDDPDRPTVGGEDAVVTRLADDRWTVVGQKAECTRPDGTLVGVELSVIMTIIE